MNIPVKRWRGYYRALKRNESWALEFSKKSVLTKVLIWTYRDIDIEVLLYREDPILKMISKDDPFIGKCFPIPNNFGDYKE